MNEVTKKIAVITGGSRGLGRNTILSLAKRGVDSIFTYHSNQAEAQKVSDQVTGTGNRALGAGADIMNHLVSRAFCECIAYYADMRHPACSRANSSIATWAEAKECLIR
jgi:NAD(P)-dependent dehydrogenase (short-subunit alcohol dehydrogenase family)